jgi:dolichol-phosphate mannosyltransferase
VKIAVCIPTYNEKESIGQTIQGIFSLNREDLVIVVIDDNSPDGTSAVVEEIAKGYPDKIVLIKRDRKLGLGNAYKAGFQMALELGVELIVEMDADGSHDPTDLPALIDAVTRDFDVAIGSRRIAGGRIVGWGVHRYLMSWGAMWISRVILGLKPRDVTSGFRCYHKNLVQQLLATGVSSGGYAFQEETLYLCQQSGARIVEVPITFRERRFGSTKLSWKDVGEFFKLMLLLKFQKKSIV